jgi:hypothetical protein
MMAAAALTHMMIITYLARPTMRLRARCGFLAAYVNVRYLGCCIVFVFSYRTLKNDGSSAHAG